VTVTIVTDVSDVMGLDDNSPWTVWSVLRGSVDGGIVTPRESVVRPVSGVLTLHLEPGYSVVSFGGRSWSIDVPEVIGSETLWDLLGPEIELPPLTNGQELAAALEAYFAANPPAGADLASLGITATATELNYTDGVTSAIQTQLNARVTSGGALGTPSSGTLTNCTGLPLSGVVDSTSEALGVGTVELGHASDTTLARSSAGVLAVEGVVVPTVSSTNTFTNKTIDGDDNTLVDIGVVSLKATGTPSSTTYLRGDGTWSVIDAIAGASPELELAHDFTNDSNGTPVTADSGQTWTLTGASPTVSSGRFITTTTTAGPQAAYLTAELVNPITFMQAAFEFTSGGGTDTQSATLVAWATNLPSGSFVSAPSTPFHISFYSTGYTIYTGTGGSLNVIATGNYGYNVTTALQRVEIALDKGNNLLYVRGADGTVLQYSDASFGAVDAEFACFEVFYNAANTDNRVKFLSVAAGSDSVTQADEYPNRAQALINEFRVQNWASTLYGLHETALNLKANLDSPTFTGTVAGITKAMVGLSNVDNTADSAKAVASAAVLTTARNINGVSFNGSANITVADATKAAISGSATGLWMGTTLPGSGAAGVLYVVTP